MRILGFATICLISTMGFTTAGLATEQIYKPVSPTFGGNPLNGTFLLSTAQAQGQGTKSGQQAPDLSGLNSALSNLGNNTGNQTPIVIIGGNGQTQIPANP